MGNEGDGVKIIERRIDSDRLGVSFLFQRYSIGQGSTISHLVFLFF